MTVLASVEPFPRGRPDRDDEAHSEDYEADQHYGEDV
jgi:hypothetical protein